MAVGLLLSCQNRHFLGGGLLSKCKSPPKKKKRRCIGGLLAGLYRGFRLVEMGTLRGAAPSSLFSSKKSLLPFLGQWPVLAMRSRPKIRESLPCMLGGFLVAFKALKVVWVFGIHFLKNSLMHVCTSSYPENNKKWGGAVTPLN